MTTYPFAPSNLAPFQFQPVLDGQTWAATVTQNVFSGAYYFNLADLSGNPVITTYLTGSTQGDPVSLLPALNPTTGKPWTSAIWFLGGSQTFVQTP